MPTAEQQISILFDADNHFWETSDAFTRFHDPRFAERGVQVKEVDGVSRYVIGGQVVTALPGPSDVHLRPLPGSILDYFTGKLSREAFLAAFDAQPADHPEWYDRDARLTVMDEQGLEAAWLFPSQGVVLEALMLSDDVEATIEVVRAYNRWIEEEWGFAYRDRIFATPYLNLSDPDAAATELQWCLDRGARVVNIRHGAAITTDGFRSPADPIFDRFWSIAEESGVVIAVHDGADGTYAEMDPLMRRVWGEDRLTAGGDDPSTMLQLGSFSGIMKTRIVHDFAYVLVAHRLFERFPRLKVAYIESGSSWVPSVLQALEYLGHAGGYATNPSDQFREHCWVAPFVEDDVDELARHLPVERILFGSDWPHGEGYAQPKDFFQNVANFSIEDQRQIMYENARALTRS